MMLIERNILQNGGMSEHIHMIVKLKPIHTLSGIMQKVKGNSSKWINEQGRLLGRFSWLVHIATMAGIGIIISV